MFEGLTRAITRPFEAVTSGAMNQFSNFGNLLTGQDSPMDFVGNTMNNAVNTGSNWIGVENPFGGALNDGGGLFSGVSDRMADVVLNDAQNRGPANIQDQASEQRRLSQGQFGGGRNPFGNQGFSNMLTGDNFAPGQRPGGGYGSSYGNPLKRGRNKGTLRDQGDVQAWR